MLNKKTQYALQALAYLAEQKTKGPVLISEIAENKKIPLKFLESILLQLRKEGLLESKKGKGGGYFLSVPPERIPLARIIRLIHGPIAMLPCVSLYFYERCKNCDERNCGLHDTMIEVRDATLKILEQKTVADLAHLPQIIK
jgi:Rrf2 family protein